jgi:hypothetical protein
MYAGVCVHTAVSYTAVSRIAHHLGHYKYTYSCVCRSTAGYYSCVYTKVCTQLYTAVPGTRTYLQLYYSCRYGRVHVSGRIH